MPRLPGRVSQVDLMRVIRAHQREGVPFKMTLKQNGDVLFEQAASSSEPNREVK